MRAHGDGTTRDVARRDAARHANRTGPEGQNGSSVFARLGQAVVRHPWRVIALWIVAVIAVVATSAKLPATTTESSFLPKSYESIRAQSLQDKAFPSRAR